MKAFYDLAVGDFAREKGEDEGGEQASARGDPADLQRFPSVADEAGRNSATKSSRGIKIFYIKGFIYIYNWQLSLDFEV